MDPIPPICPSQAHPAAIERVRRVMRAGEDKPADERRRPRREAAGKVPAPPAAAAVDGDGHLDARA